MFYALVKHGFLTNQSAGKVLSNYIIKRDNQLHLLRRLNQCSKKQINCDESIEFLRLCENFDLIQTFAKIDKERSPKWKRSLEAFTRNVISEEVKEKSQFHLR